MTNNVKYISSIIIGILLIPQPLFSVEYDSRGYVLHAYDGDTVSVRIGSTIEKVRLLGIDAPELHTKKTGVAQCFGAQARNKLSALILHKTVFLRNDPLSKNRDVYGRLLRMITISDNTKRSINEDLVEQGYAKVYRRSPISNQMILLKKEKIAQKHARGLWNSKNCSLPQATIKQNRVTGDILRD